MNLFNFNPADFLSFLLTLMRISLVLFIMPFFGGKVTPVPLKAALCLILTIALWPTLSFPGQQLPANTWAIVVMLIGEITLGLVMGIVVNVLFAAVQTGGSLIGFQMGFSMVNVADPMTGTNESITAHFMYMVTFMTFLILDGHLLLLRALAESFQRIPPGGLYLSPALAREVLGMSSQIFVLGIKIAAPVMVAVFLVDLAIALVGRAAPQMSILSFGFPLKIITGFLFLGLMFTIMARYVGQFIINMDAMFHSIFMLGAPLAR
ncbi:flagellar biosynthetic protein FliR [Desulfocurvibacter africanus PCS]|uniref:Flagellar biosynthetic protein FliR n=1 Tax=Desulfocurvibacter africanus PCS TaxID=1262666 RepID=M5Q1T1_DESAF|nr:flagellar biosynthetic protein FliR [Desulfocurvibacter africanus]EMG37846.1 flagellar biosynthetic protein FliR [Desulfocurvibacter africanus PCS]